MPLSIQPHGASSDCRDAGVLFMVGIPMRQRPWALLGIVAACSRPVTVEDAGLDATTGTDAHAPADAAAFGDGASAPDTAGGLDDAMAEDASIAPDTPAAPDAGPATCDESMGWGTPTLVAGLDGPGAEDHGAYTRDELTVVFASRRAPHAGFGDLWIGTRGDRDESFGALHRLDALASSRVDTTPSLSPDGRTLYYRTDPTDTRILVTERSSLATDFPAGAPVALVDTSDNEMSPFITATALYFAREPASLITPRDLWRAARVGGAFGAPVPIAELNTSYHDDCPVLSENELIIYFASDRPGGSGGYDIWRATRTSTTGTFGSVENVTALNSSADNLPDHLSSDGCRLYFTSNVTGESVLLVAEREP